MIYIEKINVDKDHFGNLEKGLEIECKQINLIVGDQGCGKSTLLGLLQTNGFQNADEILSFQLSDFTIQQGVETFFFDTEKNNPRTASIDNYSNPNGTSKGIGVGSALSARFMSHGEALLAFTVNGISRAENSIMFIDEPEAAMSVRNQYKLIKSIQKAAKNKCQLFIATHCFPLIEAMDEVYSLEHSKWMKSSDFLKTQKK